MSDKKDNVYVSYSGASRYKTCPTKFFLSKKYQSRYIPSALAFGKAVEEGVTALLLGQPIENARVIFEDNWTEERIKDGEKRRVLDNPMVQFYASDFDKNLIDKDDETQIYEWAKEMELPEMDWVEQFDNIAAAIKSDKQPTDEEMVFYNRVLWLCCLIRGFVMLHAFQDEILPKFELVKIDDKFAVQQEISVSNDEGDKLVGFVDYVLREKETGHVYIIDLKTAAWEYPYHALLTSEQLRTYVAAAGEKFGTNRAGYIVLLKKIQVEKKCDNCGHLREGLAKNCKNCRKGTYSIPQLSGKVQFIGKEYKAEEVEDLLEDYMNVTTAIKNEVTFKNPSNCTQYGRKCEFYEMCWGRKKASEVEHLEEKKPLTPRVEDDTSE